MTFIIRLLTVIFASLIATTRQQEETVASAFATAGVIPDPVPNAPANLLQVQYPSGDRVNLGNELTPLITKDEPSVDWYAEPNQLYTLSMIDPDAPSPLTQTFKSINHWLVINIPGKNLREGEVLMPYSGSRPPKNSGLHRYIFTVFKQPHKLSNVTDLDKTSRRNFHIGKFVASNQLGIPVAGNFYRAQYDDFVGSLAAAANTTKRP